ncbi:2Fe-2S iron-sulfur cluster-binding protein [Zoogloea sp.]|uniref:2Fe-2S iron-sulfur cluster-binding protein n=1 Tax=Zoogloea sp. TaxID=49181 RepID=UPI00262E29E8|nr:2Fe-2S iron-sulfur cluster-binding protein [Zoogloea sp.]
MPVIEIDAQDAVFDCAPGDTLLRAGLRAGLGMPYECGVGACGCCRCEVIEGEVADQWPEAPGLSDRDRRKGRVLACQTRPLGDARIRLRLDPRIEPVVRPARRTARLAAVNDITHDIREFVFRSDAPADFLPGQYAMLALPGLDRERAYSMANLPNGAGEWHFRIRRVIGGGASEALFSQLAPGAEIGLDGPYGMAWLRTDSPRDIVCIAGGSGLAPMLSVARGVAAEPSLAGRRVDFFYGGRTPADICGQPELAALPGFGEAIHYHAAVSDADAAHRAGWSGQIGPIHQLVESTLGERLGSAEFYLAGPPPMVEALQQLLQLTHKLPPERIHFDRFF